MVRFLPSLSLCVLLLLYLSCEKIELPTTGSLEVVVADLGTPIPDATVSLPDFERSATTDQFGRVRFRDLPTRTYTVEVTHPDYSPLTDEVEVKDHPVAILEVQLDLSPQLPHFRFYVPHASYLTHMMVADDTLDLNIALSNQAETSISYVISSDLQGVLVDNTLTGDRIRDRLFDLEIGNHTFTITATAPGNVQATAEFEVEVLPVPPAVEIQSVSVEGNMATITWSAVDHPLFSRYELRRAVDDASYFSFVYSGNATSDVDEIPYGKDINYRVIATMRNGDEYIGPVYRYESPVDRITFAGAVREVAHVAESNRLYVTVWDSDQLYVVDTKEWMVVQTATLPGVPDALLPSADGREMYIHLEREEQLRVYSVDGTTQTRAIPLVGRAGSTEPAFATRFAVLGDDRIIYSGYGSLDKQINIADVSTGDTLASISLTHFAVPMFVGSKDGKSLFANTGNVVEKYAVSQDGPTLRQRTVRNYYQEGQPYLPPHERFLAVGREKYDPDDLGRQIGTLDEVLLSITNDGLTGVTTYAVINPETDAKLLTLPGRTVLATVDPGEREVFFTLWDAREELYRLPY